MRETKSIPRYKCDFCKKVSTKYAMTNHEKRCFRNPNRYCDTCNNTGEVLLDVGEGWEKKEACYFCSQRDTKLEARIAKREAEERKAAEEPKVVEVPF